MVPLVVPMVPVVVPEVVPMVPVVRARSGADGAAGGRLSEGGAAKAEGEKSGEEGFWWFSWYWLKGWKMGKDMLTGSRGLYDAAFTWEGGCGLQDNLRQLF